MFGKKQIVAVFYFKYTVLPLDQRCLDVKVVGNGSRQTGGLREIVSCGAVGNRDGHGILLS